MIEGPVYIYQVPADTSLNQPSLEDLPDHHFQCERLILTLDGKSRAITRFVAERVHEPVKVFLADRYRIEGDKLVWSLGEKEAHLSDNVRIFGDIGEVTAGGAKIRPDEGICHLIGGVTAKIRGDALPGRGGDGDGEWEERMAGEWILDAHHAELHYSHGDNTDKLRLFRALAAPGEQVTIREDRENGALLLGGEMTYDPALGTIRVLKGAGPDALRPDFREGPNRVRAGQIDLSLISPLLEFSDAVDASLFRLPVGPEGKWPRWLAPEDGSNDEIRTTLSAERLRLSSTANHDLERIEAWGEEGRPLELTHSAEKILHFKAAAVDWDGPAETIRAFGDGLQQMVLEDRADISAREIQFSLATWIARGHGDVHGIAMRPRPTDGEGPPLPPLTLDGPHVEVSLRPPAKEDQEGSSGVATPASTASGTADSTAKTEEHTGEVIAARAWSDTPGSVIVDEGSFQLIGDECEWDAVLGVIRLHGRGRQRVIYRGVDGDNELSATSLVYQSSDRRLVLDGETRGRVLQGAVATAGDSEDNRLPWDIRAGSLVAHFRLEGTEERLELDRIVAGGKVSLIQPQSEIELHGDTAEWDARTERLRIYSPSGQGVQTLYRGKQRRSELIAREILLVRPTTLVPGRLDRIEALFIEVLQATVHLSDAVPDDPKNPDEFTLSANNLLVGFSGLREGEKTPGGMGMPIDEARAWGNVDFKGGLYRVLSHRTMFRRASRTLYFEGQGRQKVQVIANEDLAIPAKNKMSIEWVPPGRYRFRAVPAGQGWSRSQIEETLELFGREDRKEEQ